MTIPPFIVTLDFLLVVAQMLFPVLPFCYYFTTQPALFVVFVTTHFFLLLPISVRICTVCIVATTHRSPMIMENTTTIKNNDDHHHHYHVGAIDGVKNGGDNNPSNTIILIVSISISLSSSQPRRAKHCS
mmetsp:Transcript_37753/g.43458  ORF Transcript_37753/g.43458 Transcript_37753/m.43458 type:complete len:130 (-) Transcript_37753:176-565(-)